MFEKARCIVMLNQNECSEQKSKKEQPGRPSTVVPPHPAQTRPVRRIGTMTMGLTLVLVGVVLLIYFVHPFNLIWIARFAPVLLIVLGIEVLWQYFANRGQNLHYDFLGTVFCAFIICFAIGVSAAYPLFLKYGNNWRLEESLDSQIYDQLYTELSDLPIYLLEVSTSLVSATPETQSFTIADLDSIDHVRLYVTLKDIPDKQTFAVQVRTLLDRLKAMSYPNLIVEAGAYSSDAEYSITLRDRFMMNMSAPEIAEETYVDPIEEETYVEQASEPTAGDSSTTQDM